MSPSTEGREAFDYKGGDKSPKIYPYSAESVSHAFNCMHELYMQKLPSAPQYAKRWLAQYHFWYCNEKNKGIPWTGGSPTKDTLLEPAELSAALGPASWTNTPAGWTFPLPVPHSGFDPDNAWGGTIIGDVGDKEGNNMADLVDIDWHDDRWWKGDYYPWTWVNDTHMHEPVGGRRVPDRESNNKEKASEDNKIQLEPTSDTQLLGFETTKLQISSNCQASLMANAHRELVSLEEKSKARILIFDPFRAQDGSISDTALVFIQGEPFARHQAVKLLTAFQANLEAASMKSNVNFTFLGPGRSRGRKNQKHKAK